MTLLEIMKGLVDVTFLECRDGCLWYVARSTTAGPLIFRIPLMDVAGATFPAIEYDNPRYYMRWIRKELELQKEEQEMITKAKEEWKP